MSETKERTVLVVGATGKQGGEVVRALARGGRSRLRALVRDPKKASAEAIRHLDVELAVGDCGDVPSLNLAMAGVDAVFAVLTPFERGPEAETRYGINLVEAARRAGVSHFVYSSVANADRATGIPHFDSKYLVEEHLRQSGVPHTIVAPVFFMENLAAPWMRGGLAQGKLLMALPPDRPLQQIDVGSIARFVAFALEDRQRLLGRRIDIASDDPAGTTTAAALTSALGRPIAYVPLPLDGLRQQSEDVWRMFKWFADVGYSADIPALRRDFPDVGWPRIGEWAARNTALFQP